LVGQYLKRFAQIDQVIEPRFLISGQGGIHTSSLIKAYVGLLYTGKSDFDAIELLRHDAFFRVALGLVMVPSSPTLRQRMDTLEKTKETARSPPWTTPTNACCAAPSRPSRRCPAAIWPSTSMSSCSTTKFGENLENNLYKLWNRLASGSYQLPAGQARGDTNETV